MRVDQVFELARYADSIRQVLEAVLKGGAYEHAARASESAPIKIHSLARRACITQAAILFLDRF